MYEYRLIEFVILLKHADIKALKQLYMITLCQASTFYCDTLYTLSIHWLEFVVSKRETAGVNDRLINIVVLEFQAPDLQNNG